MMFNVAGEAFTALDDYFPPLSLCIFEGLTELIPYLGPNSSQIMDCYAFCFELLCLMDSKCCSVMKRLLPTGFHNEQNVFLPHNSRNLQRDGA